MPPLFAQGVDGSEGFFKAFAEGQFRLAQAPTESLVVEIGDTGISTTGARCAYALELPEEGVLPPIPGEFPWLIARAHGQPATSERRGRQWLAGTAGLGVHEDMVGGGGGDAEGADGGGAITQQAERGRAPTRDVTLSRRMRDTGRYDVDGA